MFHSNVKRLMKHKLLILWAEIDLRDYETVCEKVSTKFLARLPCALLFVKELINRVLVYCILTMCFLILFKFL